MSRIAPPIARAITTSPPMTPPAIAPALDFFGAGTFEDVFAGELTPVEVGIVVPVDSG